MTIYCRKKDFYEKKIRRSAVFHLSNIVVRAITLFPFNLETCSLQDSNILVLRDVYRFFYHFDEFVRVAPEQQFSFF
jgi:zona occludens toxin (predicted ATPase)